MAYKQLRRFFVIPEEMTVLSLSCFIYYARAYHEGDDNHEIHL